MEHSVSFPLVGGNPQSTLYSTGSPLTPCSNTGLVLQEPAGTWSARVDWLQAVADRVTVSTRTWVVMELERVLQTRFERRWDEPRTIGRKWDGYAIAPNGAIVCWRRLGDPGQPLSERPYCQLWWSLPGEVWRTTDTRQRIRLYQLVSILGARVTRLDLAIDDWKREFPLEDMAVAARQGQVVGFRRWAIQESSSVRGLPRGYSVTLGSPQSDLRLVAYDKWAESRGLIPAVRLELRLRDGRAQGAWSKLVGANFDYRTVAALVTGAVDFRERRVGDRHVGRRPRLSWWRQFLQRLRVEPAKLPAVGIRKSLQQTLDWLARQVSASLAIVSRVVGRDAVNQLLEFGHRLAERRDAVRVRLQDWQLNRRQVVSLFGELLQVGPLGDLGGGAVEGQAPLKVESELVKTDTAETSKSVEGGGCQLQLDFKDWGFKRVQDHGGIPPWVWESL